MQTILRPAAPSEPAIVKRGFGFAIGGLLAGLALFGLIFHAEMAAAVRVWVSSTAYNHCALVLPVAGYLAWTRRNRLAATPVQPAPWAVLLVIPLAITWLLAERLALMEGRQLAVIGLAEALCLALIGWRLFRAFASPLLYLVFLVPVGAFLEPQLQAFTSAFVVAGLDLLGISYSANADLISIREGTFYIAPACAGLRFLIAATAFGTLYACVMYRSPVRRLLFMGVSIAIPIIANGVRALGIVVLAHLLGSGKAIAADHLIYGWLFFSVVLLLIALLGLPFRENQNVWTGLALTPRPAGVTASATIPIVVLAVIVVAAAGPITARLFDRAAAQPIAIPPDFVPIAGCAPVPGGLRRDIPQIEDTAVLAVFACSDAPVSIWVEVFPPRTSPAVILAARAAALRGLANEEAPPSRIEITGADPTSWQVVSDDDSTTAIATAMWIDGHPADGLTARLQQGWNSVAGSAYFPVLVGVQSEVRGERGIQTIHRFLERHPGFASAISVLSSAGAVRVNGRSGSAG